MTTTAPALTGAARPRHLGALAATTALLVTLVAVAPFPLASALSGGRYGDLDALRAGVTKGFVQLWATGDGLLGAVPRRESDAVDGASRRARHPSREGVASQHGCR